MAGTIKTEGLEELSALLAQLMDEAQNVATGSLFEGAAVVGDAFTAATNRIVTEPFHYLARPDITGTMRYPSPEEKAALVGKSGIATFQKNGSEVNTLIGISGSSGYANINGKQVAVRMIARAINSGTSFMHKQPVYRQAVTKSRGPAKDAIVSKAEEMFNEIING